MGSHGDSVGMNDFSDGGSAKVVPTTAVRYGRMNHIGEFAYPANMKFPCGAALVVATDRGIEIGSHVSLTGLGGEQSVSRDRMRAYAEENGEESYRIKDGRILRPATEADLAELRHIETGALEKLETGRRFAAELDLDMKIVDCEHIFGGERIVFYFMAAERVDFRELVRRLAGEYQTRIEMRQVGARDEARLLADYETCGRECCCRNYLKTLKPISMQMAKLQKATLDPSKVSGRCGRLKCCLRYEHEIYENLIKRLPRVGSRVATAHGTGRVVDRQILTQLVKIMGDDERIFTVVAEDIVEQDVPEPAPALDHESGRPCEPSVPDGTLASREAKDRPGTRQAPVPETERERPGPAPARPAAPNSREPSQETTEPAAPKSAPGGKSSSRRRRGRRGRRRRRPGASGNTA